VKRLLDILASLLGLVVLSPLLVGLAVLIKLDSPGPVFHRARRVGRGGCIFELYKFRSMIADARLQGPGITVAGDERITKIGRSLRRTKLDEVPQLVNVLKGEMSLVGPRPEDPRYVAQYTPEQRVVLSARPGITSPASLQYRHEEQLLDSPDWERTYIQEVMADKLRIELDYLAHRTLCSDLRLMLKTLVALTR
jgi:lipopolysaccharide/colanic/teichoic acid biosynthesis glycosyltransferase